MRGERIKVGDKHNKHVDLLVWKLEETWDHAITWDKNKQIRDEWIDNAKEKFKVIIKNHKATDYEKKIVEQMGKYL